LLQPKKKKKIPFFPLLPPCSLFNQSLHQFLPVETEPTVDEPDEPKLNQPSMNQMNRPSMNQMNRPSMNQMTSTTPPPAETERRPPLMNQTPSTVDSVRLVLLVGSVRSILLVDGTS
jgi:hypothetical protein